MASMQKVLGRTVVVFVGLISLASQAQANAILSFDLPTIHTGNMSWGGGSDPLLGTGIGIATITGLGTSLNDGVSLTCVGCVLSFTTGALINHTTTAGPVDTFQWAGGGNLMITGGVPSAGIAANSPLLTGSWTTPVIGTGIFNTNFSVFGVGLDTKNPSLLTFFGFSGSDQFTFRDIEDGSVTGGSFGSPSGFQTGITSANVTNIVPEPATLLLLGSGLTGIGFLNRRRQKKD